MSNNVGFVLNIITFCILSLTCLISLLIFIGITYHLCYNLCTGILISHNIQTLLGDLYGNEFNSSWCIFIGYLVLSIVGSLYWAFVNQAAFRLCRVVYAARRRLQSIWLYIVIPPIELILTCMLLSPHLFWHDILYLPEEHYCTVPMTNLRGILWALFVVYGNSLILLLLIYLRITIFVSRQVNNQTLIVKQRQDRDLLVIRRILITVGLLMVLGIPTTVLLLLLYISGKEYSLIYRLEWFFLSLSMIGLSLSQVIFIPQLKNIIFKILHPNQIVPLGGTLPGVTPIRHIQPSYE